jgi:very-short-patch-repair endonuclease
MKEQENTPKRKETNQERLARMHKGASGRKFEFAKEQRRNPTETENIMWIELRGKKLGGFKFRRQHPYGRFVLDFYCAMEMLSIEIDGEIHDTPENIEYDKVRTSVIEENGITEMRFSNQEILKEKDKVLNKILKKLTQLKQTRTAK